MPALQDPHEVILSRILQLDASEFEELTRALLEAHGPSRSAALAPPCGGIHPPDGVLPP